MLLSKHILPFVLVVINSNTLRGISAQSILIVSTQHIKIIQYLNISTTVSQLVDRDH